MICFNYNSFQLSLFNSVNNPRLEVLLIPIWNSHLIDLFLCLICSSDKYFTILSMKVIHVYSRRNVITELNEDWETFLWLLLESDDYFMKSKRRMGNGIKFKSTKKRSYIVRYFPFNSERRLDWDLKRDSGSNKRLAWESFGSDRNQWELNTNFE